MLRYVHQLIVCGFLMTSDTFYITHTVIWFIVNTDYRHNNHRRWHLQHDKIILQIAYRLEITNTRPRQQQSHLFTILSEAYDNVLNIFSRHTGQTLENRKEKVEVTYNSYTQPQITGWNPSNWANVMWFCLFILQFITCACPSRCGTIWPDSWCSAVWDEDNIPALWTEPRSPSSRWKQTKTKRRKNKTKQKSKRI